MTLETLANISQIAGASTIVGGTIFGLIQLSSTGSSDVTRSRPSSCAPS